MRKHQIGQFTTKMCKHQIGQLLNSAPTQAKPNQAKLGWDGIIFSRNVFGQLNKRDKNVRNIKTALRPIQIKPNLVGKTS